MEMIHLALATINHSKERQEQRAISKLWEMLGWQVKEVSQSTEHGQKGKSLNDLDKSLLGEGEGCPVRCLAASLASTRQMPHHLPPQG